MSGTRDRSPSPRARASLVVPAALIAALLAGAAALTGEAQDGGQTAAEIQARTEGCTICARMVEMSGIPEFARDPHEFACATCHHPHTRRTAEAWSRTCQNEGCHPRAWPSSIFHRVDPEVFRDCRNCHIPHVFTADGDDCTSCHGGVHPAPGTVAAPGVTGVEVFPHERHRDLACTTCHATQTDHATLTMTSQSQCMDCHHDPDLGTPCSSCHGETPVPAGVREVPIRLEFSVWDEPRTRRLPFDHAFHTGVFECSECHEAPGFRPRVNCMDCHEFHHNDDANCAGCHQAPPEDVHDMEIHETLECGVCHENAFDAMPLDQRNFCVSCHQDMADHNEGENCAGCHKLTPESVER